MRNFTTRPASLLFVPCVMLLATAPLTAAETQRESIAPAPSSSTETTDLQIESSAEGPNVWHLKTKSRLLKMTLVAKDGKTMIEIDPVTYEGAASPYQPDTKTSIEVFPGTPKAKKYPMKVENDKGHMVSTMPFAEKPPFEGAVLLEEADHYHRYRFTLSAK